MYHKISIHYSGVVIKQIMTFKNKSWTLVFVLEMYDNFRINVNNKFNINISMSFNYPIGFHFKNYKTIKFGKLR